MHETTSIERRWYLILFPLLLLIACAAPVDSHESATNPESRDGDRARASVSALTEDAAGTAGAFASPAAGSGSSTPSSIPTDYSFVPGGWAHPSCVHEVPNGATIDEEAQTVLLDGKVVEHYQPCAYPAYKAHVPNGTVQGRLGFSNGSGPTYGGWVEGTSQWAPSGQVYTNLSGYITVPAAPSQTTPQTLYYFPGLESSLDSNCGIIQPVLQWGTSPAGGGQRWTIGAWSWSWSGQFHSALVNVSAGDTLETYIVATQSCGTHCSKYLVEMLDVTTGAYASLWENTSCRFDWGALSIFEVDAAHPITTCNQMPSYTFFTGIGLWTGPQYTQQQNTLAYNPTSTNWIGSNTPTCSWGIWAGNDPSVGNYAVLWQ